MEDIPIVFRASTYRHPSSGKQERPPVEFSTSTCPSGATITLRGHSKGGWVWATVGPSDSDQWDSLRIEGGSVELIGGFSGDDSECEVRVTHDGTSSELIITWNTRAD